MQFNYPRIPDKACVPFSGGCSISTMIWLVDTFSIQSTAPDCMGSGSGAWEEALDGIDRLVCSTPLMKLIVIWFLLFSNTFIAPQNGGFREPDCVHVGDEGMVLSSNVHGHYIDHGALQFAKGTNQP